MEFVWQRQHIKGGKKMVNRERDCIFMDVAGYGKWQRKCRAIATYMEEFEERMGLYAGGSGDSIDSI